MESRQATPGLSAVLLRGIPRIGTALALTPERNRREMLVNSLHLVVLLITATTCYRFGGRICKQREV